MSHRRCSRSRSRSRSRSQSTTPPPTSSRRRHPRHVCSSLQLLDAAEVHQMRRTEMCDYIQRLQRLVRRTAKKARMYKERYARLKKKSRKNGSDCSSSSSDEEAEPPHTASVHEHASTKPIVHTNSVEQLQNASVPTAEASVAEVAAIAPESAPVAEDPQSFVDEMKRTAQQMAGFVYEPTSGLYYDSKTGYYFNAEHGLYYDGNTGCYYDYDKDKHEFVFHSHAYADSATTTAETATTAAAEPAGTATKQKTTVTTRRPDKTTSSAKRKARDSRSRSPARRERHRHEHRHRRRRHRSSSSASNQSAGSRRSTPDREDGELSSEAESEREEEEKVEMAAEVEPVVELAKPLVEPVTYEDIARKYPPSLRLVVLETVQPKLRVGQLFMVTYKGGTLGREGDHDVIIPDINVSKFHCTFRYNHDDGRYECTDLGSRNGTILDGRRMSNAKQESPALPVEHGSVIGLSQTRLLCHVHEGHSNCAECDPCELMAAAQSTGGASSAAPDGTTGNTHKQELKQLKKRYGLADQKYLIQQCTMTNDRSAKRRALVGSSDGNEKTQVASVDSNIPTNNKGFKMLAKLGWSQGQTLGKNDTGLLEPIPLQSNTGTKGLGCAESMPTVSAAVAKRAEQARKTQERYNANATATAEPKDIFEDDH